MEGQLALAMFVAVCAILLLGFPVALTLGGTALGFAALGILIGQFDPDYLTALTGRIFGTMGNETLVAVPLFILMGVVLERAKFLRIFWSIWLDSSASGRGGLALPSLSWVRCWPPAPALSVQPSSQWACSPCPACSGRATSPSWPLARSVRPALGQIIPPSIALVLLGDIMSSAYQQAQLRMNIINTDTVSVGDLFIGAMVPVALVMMYLAYVLLRAAWQPETAPPAKVEKTDFTAAIKAVLPPLGLIAWFWAPFSSAPQRLRRQRAWALPALCCWRSLEALSRSLFCRTFPDPRSTPPVWSS